MPEIFGFSSARDTRSSQIEFLSGEGLCDPLKALAALKNSTRGQRGPHTVSFYKPLDFYMRAFDAADKELQMEKEQLSMKPMLESMELLSTRNQSLLAHFSKDQCLSKSKATSVSMAGSLQPTRYYHHRCSWRRISIIWGLRPMIQRRRIVGLCLCDLLPRSGDAYRRRCGARVLALVACVLPRANARNSKKTSFKGSLTCITQNRGWREMTSLMFLR